MDVVSKDLMKVTKTWNDEILSEDEKENVQEATQNPEKPNLDDVPFDEENMDEASWEILLSPDLKRKLNEP